MVNYQNGKIYKMEDVGGNMCYIGSTTKDFLSKRMSEHRSKYRYWKSDPKNSKFTVFDIFDTYGIENCRIVLIELLPCDSKDELHARESHYIRTVECVNKIIPNRTKAEYSKKRYKENKVKIQAKQAAVVECECGKTFTRAHKRRHIKSTHHIDYIANIPLNV